MPICASGSTAPSFDLHGVEGRGLQVIDVGPVDAEVVVGEVSAAGCEWAYRAVVRAVNDVPDRPDVLTPVDHGTALDIAGQGVANADRLVDAARYAIHYAIQLIRGRRAAANAKETA